MNKAIKKILEYEKEGYRYELMDTEESQYNDAEALETGDRVVIQVAMKRGRKWDAKLVGEEV